MIIKTTTSQVQVCKCCHGSGTQTGNDGITIECPCCYGEGYKYPTLYPSPYITWMV